MQRCLPRMGAIRTRLLIGLVFAALVCGVLAPAPASGDAAASAVKVRFVEPGAALLEGTIRITVEASTSPDATIASVSVFADDRLLSTLEHPPYTFTWDSGHGAGMRTLRAVAEDSLGRKAETVLVSRRLGAVQYEDVRLVQVYAAVRDARGRPEIGRAHV